MVEHKCHKCGKIFTRKSDLNNHLNRINPCDKNKPKFKCEHCLKKYCRKDTLNKHIKTKHPDGINNTIKTCIEGDKNNTIAGNKNIAGNNNNITIDKSTNQFFVLPFGTYHLDEDLTTTEKVAIFASKHNSIIEMIIFKTHLNPALEKYHNCGITDLHSGYGLINDGDDWKCWPIKDIMSVLIDNGQQNSLKLYEQIKHFFQDDTREEIEHDLNNDQHLLYPRHNFFDIDTKAKRKLVLSLKSNFYNQRNLVQTAVKNSGKNLSKNDDKDSEINILKEGVTIADIDDYLKKEKERKDKSRDILALKKEIATYILRRLLNLTNIKYNEFVEKINEIDNIEALNIIVCLLNKSYCRGININNLKIEDEINKQIKMNESVLES